MLNRTECVLFISVKNVQEADLLVDVECDRLDGAARPRRRHQIQDAQVLPWASDRHLLGNRV
jgi:hypothetical protein